MSNESVNELVSGRGKGRSIGRTLLPFLASQQPTTTLEQGVEQVLDYVGRGNGDLSIRAVCLFVRMRNVCQSLVGNESLEGDRCHWFSSLSSSPNRCRKCRTSKEISRARKILCDFGMSIYGTMVSKLVGWVYFALRRPF